MERKKVVANNSLPGRQIGNVIMGEVPGSKSTSKLISSGVSLACSEVVGRGRGRRRRRGGDGRGTGWGEGRGGDGRGKRW